MMTEVAEKAKPVAERQKLEPTRIYSRKDLTSIFGANRFTFMRAYKRGHLQGYTVGSLVFHTGEQVLNWLAAGGKTA